MVGACEHHYIWGKHKKQRLEELLIHLGSQVAICVGVSNFDFSKPVNNLGRKGMAKPVRAEPDSSATDSEPNA